jgi:hypothetical protein
MKPNLPYPHPPIIRENMSTEMGMNMTTEIGELVIPLNW